MIVPVVLNEELSYGAPVFMFGNPGVLRDIYRQGYVSGFDLDRREIYFSFPSYPGDSGSGIFDEAGNEVALMSFTQYAEEIDDMSPEALAFTLAGANEFRFTKEQIELASK